MAASETGSAAWPGRLPGGGSDGFGHRGDRHRRRRHGRRRRLHQPRLSGQGHPLGFLDPAAVGGRRHRRAVRGVFLQRTRRDVSALERRIQFPQPRLSSGVRISRGLGFGDGRFRSTGGAGRDGVRANMASRYSRARRRCALAIGVVWLVSLVQLGGVRHSSTFQLIATILKVVLIVALPDRGICHRHAAAGLVRASMSPTSPISPARRSRSAWCS